MRRGGTRRGRKRQQAHNLIVRAHTGVQEQVCVWEGCVCMGPKIQSLQTAHIPDYRGTPFHKHHPWSPWVFGCVCVGGGVASPSHVYSAPRTTGVAYPPGSTPPPQGVVYAVGVVQAPQCMVIAYTHTMARPSQRDARQGSELCGERGGGGGSNKYKHKGNGKRT